MKILEIGTLNIKHGGPPFSMSRQMYGLKMNGVDSMCLMPECEEADIIDPSLEYSFTKPVISLGRYSFIPDVDETLSKQNDVDLIHIHGVWDYYQHSVARYAREKGIPYVIAPRGALYGRAIREKSYIKKRLAWFIYQKQDLDKADCVQATCWEEMLAVRELGCKTPIAIIPNSYDVDFIKRGTYTKCDEFTIGYLGRLHPRKHVEKLLYALKELKNRGKKAKLIIIGSDNSQYEDYLKEETKRVKLGESVNFSGFLRGDALDAEIRKCHIFAFPSDYENWGNVVPDVLVREIPVITSKGMPWKILEEKRCGWWIDVNQDILNRTLLQAYEMDINELEEMGKRGRTLVEEKFSVGPIGSKIKELYTWILEGGVKPDFVY